MGNPITPLDPQQTEQAEQQTAKEGYVHRALVGLDEFANVLLGGLPDETISSRMARWSTEDKGLRKAIGSGVSRFLDLFQKDHGAKAEAGDAERGQSVVDTEEQSGNIAVSAKPMVWQPPRSDPGAPPWDTPPAPQPAVKTPKKPWELS